MSISLNKLSGRLLILIAMSLSVLVAVAFAAAQVSADTETASGSRNISSASLYGTQVNVPILGPAACFPALSRSAYTVGDFTGGAPQIATLEFRVDNDGIFIDAEHVEQVLLSLPTGWTWNNGQGDATDTFPIPQNPIFKGMGTDGVEINGLSVSDGHTWDFSIDVSIPASFGWDPSVPSVRGLTYQLEGDAAPGTSAPHFTIGEAYVSNCELPPELDVSKTVDPAANNNFGDELTYVISATNNQATLARNVEVFDIFPSEVTDISCNCVIAPTSDIPVPYSVTESDSGPYDDATQQIVTTTYKIVVNSVPSNALVDLTAPAPQSQITLTVDTSAVTTGRPGDIDFVVLTGPDNTVYDLGDIFDEENTSVETEVINLGTLAPQPTEFNGVWSLEIAETDASQAQAGSDGNLTFELGIHYTLPQAPADCSNFDDALVGNTLNYTIPELAPDREARISCETTIQDLLTVSKWAVVGDKMVTDIITNSNTFNTSGDEEPTFHISATNQTAAPIQITSVADVVDFAGPLADVPCVAITQGILQSNGSTFVLPNSLPAGDTVRFTCQLPPNNFIADFTNKATVNTSYSFINQATITNLPDVETPSATVSDVAGVATMAGNVVADVIVEKSSGITNQSSAGTSTSLDWDLGESITYSVVISNYSQLDGTVVIQDNLPFSDDQTCGVDVFPSNPRMGTTTLTNAVAAGIPEYNAAMPPSLTRNVTLATGVSTALVSGVQLTDVAINHEFLGDLNIQLVSPSGKRLTILNQAGLAGHNPGGTGSDSNFVRPQPISYADGGADGPAELIGVATAGGGDVQSGEYSPSPDGDPNSDISSFAGFVDEPANGQWSVIFTDLSTGVTGRFFEYELVIEWYEGPVAADVTAGQLRDGYEVSLQKLGGYATVECEASPSIDIELAKNPPTQNVGPGEQIEFSVTVTNTGHVPLARIVTTDVQFPGCNFDSFVLPGFTTLRHGESYTYTCTDNTPSGNYTNTMTVVGYLGNGSGNLSNTASAEILNAWPPRRDQDAGIRLAPPIVEDTATATVVVGEPTLTLDVNKELAPNPGTQPGETLGYTITVKNTGNVEGLISITDDYLDVGTGQCMSFESATGNPTNNSADSKVTWSNIPLLAGDEYVAVINFTLDVALDKVGCPNEVIVVGTNPDAGVVTEIARYVPQDIPPTNAEVCVTLQGARTAGQGEAIDWELRSTADGSVLSNGSAVTSATDNGDGTSTGCFDVEGIVDDTYDVYIIGDYDDPNGDVLGVLAEDVVLTSSVDLTSVILLEGDANDDNQVRSSDLGIWAGEFLQNGDGLAADFNEDDKVRASDLALWQANFFEDGVRAFFAGATASRSAQAETIRVVPNAATVDVGESADMTVQADFGSNTYNIVQVKMTYDASKVAVSNIEAAAGLTIQVDASTAGTILVVMTGSVTGSGVDLLTFDVTGVAEGSAMFEFVAGDVVGEDGTLAYLGANPQAFAGASNPSITVIGPGTAVIGISAIAADPSVEIGMMNTVTVQGNFGANEYNLTQVVMTYDPVVASVSNITAAPGLTIQADTSAAGKIFVVMTGNVTGTMDLLTFDVKGEASGPVMLEFVDGDVSDEDGTLAYAGAAPRTFTTATSTEVTVITPTAVGMSDVATQQAQGALVPIMLILVGFTLATGYIWLNDRRHLSD